jgi:pyridinium-3,5-bisthiocarboxylic acid mononucleotide nickel chelatase
VNDLDGTRDGTRGRADGAAPAGRLAWFDCFAGIAGDMVLGALLDAGADEARLRDGLARLPIDPFELVVEPAERGGIGATRVRVRPAGTRHARLRKWGELRGSLDGAELPAAVLARALATFERLALAEGRVHRRRPEDVHFHELGAVDTVVDVVGAALLLDQLGVEEIWASPVALGSGPPRPARPGSHGPLPVPGPAVLELLRGVPVRGGGVAAELTTPTGAAILAASASGFGELPPVTVASIGYGAGSREHAEVPNLLRVVLGDRVTTRATSPAQAGGEEQAAGGDTALVLEANIDDMTPELAAWAVERALAAGASDAWLTPVQMKKGRPGVLLSVLCSPGTEAALRALLWRETPTLGVRGVPVRKWMLARRLVEVEVPGGRGRVKLGLDGQRVVNLAPEFADCAAVATATGTPLKEVMARAQAAALAVADELRGG